MSAYDNVNINRRDNPLFADCIQQYRLDDSDDMDQLKRWITCNSSSSNDTIIVEWTRVTDTDVWYTKDCCIELPNNTIYKAWMPGHGNCVYKYIKRRTVSTQHEYELTKRYTEWFTLTPLSSLPDGFVVPFVGFDVDICYRNMCHEVITVSLFNHYSICASMIVHQEYIADTICFLTDVFHHLYEEGNLWLDAKLCNVVYNPATARYRVIDIGSVRSFYDDDDTISPCKHYTFNECQQPIFTAPRYFNTFVIGITLLDLLCSRFHTDVLLFHIDAVAAVLHTHRDATPLCNSLITILFYCFGDTLEWLRPVSSNAVSPDSTGPVPWPQLREHIQSMLLTT